MSRALVEVEIYTETRADVDSPVTLRKRPAD